MVKKRLSQRDWKIVSVAILHHLNSQRLEDFGSEQHFEKHKEEIRKILEYAKVQGKLNI